MTLSRLSIFEISLSQILLTMTVILLKKDSKGISILSQFIVCQRQVKLILIIRFNGAYSCQYSIWIFFYKWIPYPKWFHSNYYIWFVCYIHIIVPILGDWSFCIKCKANFTKWFIDLVFWLLYCFFKGYIIFDSDSSHSSNIAPIMKCSAINMNSRIFLFNYVMKTFNRKWELTFNHKI